VAGRASHPHLPNRGSVHASSGWRSRKNSRRLTAATGSVGLLIPPCGAKGSASGSPQQSSRSWCRWPQAWSFPGLKAQKPEFVVLSYPAPVFSVGFSPQQCSFPSVLMERCCTPGAHRGSVALARPGRDGSIPNIRSCRCIQVAGVVSPTALRMGSKSRASIVFVPASLEADQSPWAG